MLKRLVEVTNAQRYDDENDVNIYTADSIQIAASAEPARVGENRFGHKDPNGVPIVAQGDLTVMIETALAPDYEALRQDLNHAVQK